MEAGSFTFSLFSLHRRGQSWVAAGSGQASVRCRQATIGCRRQSCIRRRQCSARGCGRQSGIGRGQCGIRSCRRQSCIRRRQCSARGCWRQASIRRGQTTRSGRQGAVGGRQAAGRCGQASIGGRQTAGLAARRRRGQASIWQSASGGSGRNSRRGCCSGCRSGRGRGFGFGAVAFSFDREVGRGASSAAFQGHHHGPLFEVGQLAVFQQPAVHDLHRGHALKDTGDHHLRGGLAIAELHGELITDLHAVQAAAVDVSGVHQIVIAGDDVDGSVIAEPGLACVGQGQGQKAQAE